MDKTESPRKKLIEVALPLEVINREAAREKSIRHGHPSTLHLWWARRPLAACRAVLFASLVDDPSCYPEKFHTEEEQEEERQRLFRIIEDLVKWENSNKETVLAKAKEEILKSCSGNPPPVMDPFSGGGSIPLEAQRLGLEAHASDLNPVAVLITKALIEIPPKFAGKPPVNPDWQNQSSHAKEALGDAWRGARGLAEDVRYYGKWMRDEAEKQIGHLYPKVKLPKEHGGGDATVIAWLWARTVKCPNPACGAVMPLVRSFILSTKKGKETWVEPLVDKKNKTVRFEVKSGDGKAPEGTVSKKKFNGVKCIFCNSNVSFEDIRSSGRTLGLGVFPLAMVVDGKRGRIYMNFSKEDSPKIQTSKEDFSFLKVTMEGKAAANTPLYGLPQFLDLFTARQLVALTTFSDLVGEARERVLADAKRAGLRNDDVPLNDDGTCATAYADAVATYLAFAVDKGANYWSSICVWHTSRETITCTFARQAIPMTWDFAEANPLSDSTGNFFGAIEWVANVVENSVSFSPGIAKQEDATSAINNCKTPLISTDPPYYDNIGYADLSDFFYVWLRRSLGKNYPNLFNTMLVPKTQELVATAYRFEGSKARAQKFFEEGLGKAFLQMRKAQHPEYPMTVFYAFKQTETEDKEDEEESGDHAAVASTGWEAMLEGLLKAQFQITGTWPMRTEMITALKRSTNALASSIVLVCRSRPENAPAATRREFLDALHKELPTALKTLQQGNIAPVDLAQAAIGPGMAIFSRYSKIMEADGKQMTIRVALGLINQILDEALAEQDAEYDADTRWALAWFEQFGMNQAPYGEAETLSKAKNISVAALAESGILHSKAGRVSLLKAEEFSATQDPSKDHRISDWKMMQQLIRALKIEGEQAASRILSIMRSRGERIRALAYRLYNLCDRKGWSSEALSFNMLVASWSEIEKLAGKPSVAIQGKLIVN
jgi:putative DNA methylase